MIEKGTLRDLLDSVRDKSPVALNVLDLPLGKTSVPIPPSYIDVATDAHSLNLVKRLVDLRDMSDVTSWGTAGTPDALSWYHIDDDGFSTVVWVQTGGKWWVLARKRNADPLNDEMRDIATFRDWRVDDIDEDHWDAEAVHLESHCVL